LTLGVKLPNPLGAAVGNLAVSGDEAALGVYRRALTDSAEPVNSFAATRILCSVGPSEIPTFREALGSETPHVRRHGAFGLAELGDRDSATLARLRVMEAHDPDSETKLAARGALEILSKPA
jgi:HEAT repeat protein